MLTRMLVEETRVNAGKVGLILPGGVSLAAPVCLTRYLLHCGCCGKQPSLVELWLRAETDSAMNVVCLS